MLGTLFCALRNGGCRSIEADLRMGSIAKRFVGGSATAAQSNLFSSFDFVSAGVKQGYFPGYNIRTFRQDLNRWL